MDTRDLGGGGTGLLFHPWGPYTGTEPQQELGLSSSIQHRPWLLGCGLRYLHLTFQKAVDHTFIFCLVYAPFSAQISTKPYVKSPDRETQILPLLVTALLFSAVLFWYLDYFTSSAAHVLLR